MNTKKRPFFFVLVMLPVLFFFVLGAVFFSSCNTKEKAPLHHALLVINRYAPVSEKSTTVVPYEVNLMALDLLRNKENPEVQLCQDYIQWYFNHLNPSDIYGMTGSIYEYDVTFDGREVPLKHFDHVDSTSATFILLLHRFYKVTGYKRFLETNWEKIANIAYLIPYLQDEHDGLIRSLPSTSKKYLRNNCECCAAIAAFVELSEEFDRPNPEFTDEFEEALEEAILTHFYRKTALEFSWLIDGDNKYAPDWKTLYPDSISQLFPLLYHIMPGEKERRELWKKFGNYYKIFPEESKPTSTRIVFRWTTEALK